MADCGKYDNMINALIDGELTESEIDELKEHARNCRSCAELIKLYSAMYSAMNDTEETPPNDLSQNIMSQIRHDNKKSKKGRGLRRLTAVAAVLVVVISGLFMLNQTFYFSDSSNTSSVGDSAVMEAASDVSPEEFSADTEASQASSAAEISTYDSSSSADTEPAETETEAEPEQSSSKESGQTFGILGEESSIIEIFYTDASGNEITIPVDVSLLDELLSISGVSSETVAGEPVCKIKVAEGEEQIYPVWVSNDTVLVQGTDGVLYISDISLERLESILP